MREEGTSMIVDFESGEDGGSRIRRRRRSSRYEEGV